MNYNYNSTASLYYTIIKSNILIEGRAQYIIYKLEGLEIVFRNEYALLAFVNMATVHLGIQIIETPEERNFDVVFILGFGYVDSIVGSQCDMF